MDLAIARLESVATAIVIVKPRISSWSSRLPPAGCCSFSSCSRTIGSAWCTSPSPRIQPRSGRRNNSARPPLGSRTALFDSRSGSRVRGHWCNGRRYGHHESGDRSTIAVAKRCDRTVSRIRETRMPRSRDHRKRRRPTTHFEPLRGVLPTIADPLGARKGRPGLKSASTSRDPRICGSLRPASAIGCPIALNLRSRQSSFPDHIAVSRRTCTEDRLFSIDSKKKAKCRSRQSRWN
jgi:hypothetical protein